MKKSTVGMLLLVAMVVVKAYVDRFDSNEPDLVARTMFNSDPFTISNADVSPTAQLLAAEFALPKLSQLVDQRSKEVDVSWPVDQDHSSNNLDHQLLASNEQPNTDEEIIPLDHSSHTGYGFLNRSAESWKKHSTLDQQAPRTVLKGEVPLDGANTISENMSRLFPLNQ